MSGDSLRVIVADDMLLVRQGVVRVLETIADVEVVGVTLSTGHVLFGFLKLNLQMTHAAFQLDAQLALQPFRCCLHLGNFPVQFIHHNVGNGVRSLDDNTMLAMIVR